MKSYQTELSQQLEQMNIDLSNDQVSSLIAYLELLIKWNKAYNLTSVRDPYVMISRHLADSLSILPYIKNMAINNLEIVDVGSGAGLPGIPLSICLPESQVTTIDSNGKKTRFQQQVKLELNIDNLTVVNSRVEAYQPGPFDLVISRAFASINDMLDWTDHLCKENGYFLAMKGLYPEQEILMLKGGYSVKDSYQLVVPKCDAERHLLIVGRA